jgi:hypothetical protein
VNTVSSEIPPALVDSNTITFYREDVVAGSLSPPPPPSIPSPPSPPRATCGTGGGFVRYDNLNMQVSGNTPTGSAPASDYYDGADRCCEICMNDATCGGFVATPGEFGTCYFKDVATVSSEIPPGKAETGITTFYKESLVYVPQAPPSPPSLPRLTCGAGGGYTRYDNKNMQTIGSAPTGEAASTIGYGGGDECCERCGRDPTCGGFVATPGEFGTCYFKDRATAVSEVPPALDEINVTTFYKDDILTEADSLRFNGLVRVDLTAGAAGGSGHLSPNHWSQGMQDRIFVVQSSVYNWANAPDYRWTAIMWDGCNADIDGDCSSEQWYSCREDQSDRTNCNNVYSAYFGQWWGNSYVKEGVAPGTYEMKLILDGDPRGLTGYGWDCFSLYTTFNTLQFEVRPNMTTVISGRTTADPSIIFGDINGAMCATGDWTISYETVESRFPGLVPAVGHTHTTPIPPREDPAPFVPPVPFVAVVATAIGNTVSAMGVAMTAIGLFGRMSHKPTQPQTIERTPMLSVRL